MARIKYFNTTTQEWEYADGLSGGGIPDAPSDGKQYARKDGEWSEVQGGGYEPPVGGIPKTDLASDVQASLDKADTSVQPDDIPYVTPEQFGAVGDGVTDDTEAIQNMVDSGYNIKCQKKTYKITDTITFENHSSRYRTCDFEAAHIVYTGNSYAFKFTRSNNAVLKLGRVTANNGGCLHMYSDTSANSIQYVDVYFFALTAATNGIFIEQAATAGWINQVNFYNGRFAGGANGCLASGSMNHINWYNIGVEGVTNGFNLDSKYTGITRWSFINCRYEESFTKFIVATGAVTGVTIIGGRGFSTSHYTVNSQCDKWIIFGANNFPADNPLATVTYLIKGSFISNNNAYNSLAGGIQIQNGDDLNSYTNVGNYYSASNTITNSLLHKPSGSSLGVFKLEVMDLTGRWNASDKFLLQTIHSRNTVSVYIRAYYDNSWKAWREYRTDSETYIDNGANLNSLTSIGTYYCASNAIAASLLNAPSGLNKVFQMRVIPLANSNRDATYQYYIQEINQAERTYRRNMVCENNAWSFGEWIAFDPSTYATEAWVNNQGFIKQHQSLAAYRTSAAQDVIDATKQDAIADLATIRSGAALGATAVQPEAGKGLFSGNYNDLANKPTIPEAVTDAHINALIDAKIGDAIGGSY